MNGDSNSDSEQCTESKLGRVHRVNTQGTQPAFNAHIAPRQCAQRHVMVHKAPCRGRALPCRSAHWPCFRPCRACTLPCRHPLRSRYKKIVLRLNPCRWHSVMSCAHSAVSKRYRSLYRDPKGRPQPQYKICIATHPQRLGPESAHAARLTARPAVSWCLLAVSQDCWPYRGPLLHALHACVTIHFTIS